MKIVQSMITGNACYQANVAKQDSRYTSFQKNGPKGLMLHSVGCAQPSAQVFVNTFGRSGYDAAAVHAFIDGNTGTVYQTMPWNYRAWHCGGDANNTHLGVEMCEPSGISYGGGATFSVTNKTEAVAVAKTTYNAAVELFAYLCKKFNINPLTGIISHREGAVLGVASNHGDPEHLWKGLGLGYTMDTFRVAVKAAMTGTAVVDTQPAPVQKTTLYRVRKVWSDATSQVGAYSNLDNAKECCNKYAGYSVYDEAGKAVYTNAVASNPTAAGYIPYYYFTAGPAGAAVYADSRKTKPIGSLNPGEKCKCIDAGTNQVAAWYALDDAAGHKIGYVDRSAGTVG